MTIKELCIEYGMKQTELARRFGIPIRTVQDWYSGKRVPPEYVINMMIEILKYDTEKR